MYNETLKMLRKLFLFYLTLLPLAGYPATQIITLSNGDSYEGEIRDGIFEGSGLYVWASGDRYEGQFLNDLPHGTGTYQWVDGRSYEGTFLAGKRHGIGVLTWSNGDK